MNFLYHLNLNKAAEIQNALLHRVTGSGLLDTVAQIAFDTVVSHPKIFDGTAVRTFILSNDVLDDVTISGSSSTQVVSQNATKTFISSSIATIANTSLTLSGSANHILINGDVSSSLNLTQNRTFILSLPSTVNLSNLSVSGNLYLSGVQNITTSSLNFLISSGSEYVTKTISGSELVNLIGLSNVENITLSTWTGSVNLIKVGTITEGEWNGIDIADAYIGSSNTWHGKQDALSGSGFVKISGTTISYDNSTYLTGNQTITLSGDVSGSGETSISTTVTKINGTSLAGLATGLLKNTTSTGVPSIAVAGIDYIAGGVGTANYISKFSGSGVLGNSLIYENGTTLETSGIIRAMSGTYTAVGTGKGVEISYDSVSDYGQLLSYDRAGSAFKPFYFNASQIRFQISSTTKGLIDSNGLIVGGTATNSGDVFTISNGGLAQIEFGQFTSTLARTFFFNRSSGLYITNQVNALDHRFFIGASEKVRIDSSGNIGVNTTSPTRLITVNDSQPYIGFSVSNVEKWVIGRSVSGYFGAYNNTLATFPLAIFDSTGNVSIMNQLDSGYRLDVTGTGRFTGALTLNSYLSTGAGSGDIRFGDGTGYYLNFKINAGTTKAALSDSGIMFAESFIAGSGLSSTTTSARLGTNYLYFGDGTGYVFNIGRRSNGTSFMSFNDIAGAIGVSGVMTISNTTTSTSTTTGALIVSGGLGVYNIFTNYANISSNLYVTGSIFSSGSIRSNGNIFVTGSGNYTSLVSASDFYYQNTSVSQSINNRIKYVDVLPTNGIELSSNNQRIIFRDGSNLYGYVEYNLVANESQKYIQQQLSIEDYLLYSELYQRPSYIRNVITDGTTTSGLYITGSNTNIANNYAQLVGGTSSLYVGTLGVRMTGIKNNTVGTYNILVSSGSNYTIGALQSLPNSVLSNSSIAFVTSSANGLIITGSSVSLGATMSLNLVQDINTTASPTFNNLSLTGNVTVGGNVTVNGTVTQINSTQVEIGDNIILLNKVSNVADAGIYIIDALATTGTGSLLWDATNNYWKGGWKDSEYRMSQFSGSMVTNSFVSINSSGYLISNTSPTTIGDIYQWGGSGWSVTNIIDGGSY